MTEDQATIATRCPHWSRAGDRLRFATAPDTTYPLAPAEIAIFDAISRADRPASDLDPTLRERWQRDGIIALVPPERARAARPHVVVLEPHADDAALSCGGRIAARTERGDRVTIVTVAPRSTFTRDWLAGRQRLDAATVTRLRREESALAARILGAQHHALDLDEATLRFAPADAWNDRDFPRISRAFSAFFDGLPLAADVASWALVIARALARLAPIDELWIPLAIGEHVDHRLVRDATLTALAARGASPIPRVTLYEDLPYAHHHPAHAEQLAADLEAGGLRLTRERVDIAATHARKQRAVAAYASQADPADFARAIAAPHEIVHHLAAPAPPPPPARDPRLAALPRALIALAPFARPAEELALFRPARLIVHRDHAWQLPPTAKDAQLLADPRDLVLDGPALLTLSPHAPNAHGAALAERVIAGGGIVVPSLIRLLAPLTYGESTTPE